MVQIPRGLNPMHRHDKASVATLAKAVMCSGILRTAIMDSQGVPPRERSLSVRKRIFNGIVRLGSIREMKMMMLLMYC